MSDFGHVRLSLDMSDHVWTCLVAGSCFRITYDITVVLILQTIEFELRKLEAQQSMEHIDLLKSFMPNSFLTLGGDYDAILTLMLLPRLLFKADLVLSQLRQQV